MSGGRLALGTGAGLAALVVAAFLTGGGETVTPRGRELVQLPNNTSLIIDVPTAIAPTPTPLPPPPAAAPLADAGIWSTPAEFAPPE